MRGGGRPGARGSSPRDAGPPRRGAGKPGQASHGPGKPSHGPSRGGPSFGPPRPGQARPSTPEGTHTSPRVPIARGKPRPGTWIWTCREDATGDLVDELRAALADPHRGDSGKGDASKVRVLEPGLVESRGAPTFVDDTVDVTFARQGLPVTKTVASDDVAAIGACVAELAGASPSFTLHVWSPDTEVGNRRMPACTTLEARVLEALAARDAALAARHVSSDARAAGDGALVSIVSRGDGSFAIGALPMRDAISPFPGGRARMRVEKDSPSRASRKVEEALSWLGIAPGPGEVCVDLGAAPGGWSWALLERRARVIAVDPAELRPDVAKHRGMRHEKKSAFTFEPDEPVDWLFCDMAWRPLEAAQLLAKWGRRRWARVCVANLKLPMKQKHKIAEELRAIVHGGGWSRVRTRQLYHDRDEITLLAIR